MPMIKRIKDRLDGKELDLSLSELTEVPEKELMSLVKATHIDLSCNHLTMLSPTFANLKHIVKLDLSKNSLTELPANFGHLHSLQYLDLYMNKIVMLPVSFCQLKTLKWLDLKNNPLDNRLAIVAGDCLDEKQCQKCSQSVVSFMKSIQSQLERERQKRLKEEREKEAEVKAAEEEERAKQKLEKKIAKEKRKAEMKLKKEKESTEFREENHSNDVDSADLRQDDKVSETEVNGEMPKDEPSSGLDVGRLLSTLTFATVVVALSLFVLIHLQLGRSLTLSHVEQTFHDCCETFQRYFFVYAKTIKDKFNEIYNFPDEKRKT